MVENSLEIQQLCKSFGSLKAVDHICLSVHQGEIFGFLGPNGAGKTTTINMICGLLNPDSGNIYIDGNQVKKGESKIFLRVGVCTQQNIYWEKLTCLEQLIFIGNLYHMTKENALQRAELLLDQLGLTEKRNFLASKLSGGMQRRLNLALSLIHDPTLIILDEPETGLDPQSRVMVRDFIRSLARKKTVILTTHNMDEADRLADRVAIIDHGKLLVVDTPNELKRKIGEGDVVEIKYSGEITEKLLTDVRNQQIEVTQADHSLFFRTKGIIEKIPIVLSLVRASGIETGEISLRSNSLEDVFIAITGRRLRE